MHKNFKLFSLIQAETVCKMISLSATMSPCRGVSATGMTADDENALFILNVPNNFTELIAVSKNKCFPMLILEKSIEESIKIYLLFH